VCVFSHVRLAACEYVVFVRVLLLYIQVCLFICLCECVISCAYARQHVCARHTAHAHTV
jgi:hypothetical protein